MHTFLKFEKLFIVLLVTVFIGCSEKKEQMIPDSNNHNQEENYGTSLWGTITDENNMPIEGVVVTNGFEVTKTDNKGIYQLNRNLKARFVYYTTPAGYEINLTANKHPDFYSKIDLSKSLRYDFKLKTMSKEEIWTLVCVGDPQISTMDNVERYKNETMDDLDRTVNVLKSSGESVYAITLGDIVHDQPELYPMVKSTMDNRSATFFQVLGNHDHTKNMSDAMAHEVYENHFGPRNYSFDRGDVHIVAIDNYINLNDLQNQPTGGLTEEIWEWLKADLSQVPKEKMVILCAHVPFRQGTASTHGKDVVNLLKTYNEAHIMTGHTHTNYKWKHDNNPSSKLTEHTHGTACGAHWRSRVCSDGTPNGYAVYHINRNRVADYYYKATGEQYNRSYQMRLYDGAHRFYQPGSDYYFNKEFGGNAANRVVANIWNGDFTWQVTIEEEGYASITMQQTTKAITDWCIYSYHLHYKDKIWTGETDHFWHALLPSGKKPVDATFTVRAKDVRNNVIYTASSSPEKPNIQFDYEGIAYP